AHGRRSVCMADKSNAMTQGHALWQRVFKELAPQYPGIEPRHLRGFRAAAERELGLIESALIPVARRKDASSRAKAGELAREIAGQLEIVRSSLIRSALSRLDP
ncbi:MAG: hypothetical protein V4479_01295, partial [Actinomycetota bacterium]